MKTSEFRIGNIMHGGTITEIGKDYLKFRDDYQTWNTKNMIDGLRHLRPICITDKILIKKLGFELIQNENTLIHSSYRNFSFTIDKYKNGEFMYGWIGGNIQIKYVHQLQNLYYALHGKELKSFVNALQWKNFKDPFLNKK